jgi:uncharacterized protein (TIGR02231 family)
VTDSEETSEVTIATTLISVTLFEDRAEVERRFVLPPGVRRARLSGLSPCILPRSIEITALSAEPARDGTEIEIPSHRLAFRLLGDELDDTRREAVETCRAALREATRRHDEAAEREARAHEQRSRFDSLVVHVMDDLLTLPRKARPSAAANATEAELADTTFTVTATRRPRAALETLRENIARTIEEEAAAYAARLQAAEEITRAERRLAEASTMEPELAAELHLGLSATSPSATADEGDDHPAYRLRYRVASALWRPAHLARLVTEESSGESSVEIATYATAWQTTGEHWENASLRFSTARPMRPASPPALVEDVLQTTRKTDHRVVVAARDQTVAVAGLRESGAADSAELLGVDDGGEALLFEAKTNVTFPSTGRPLRVEVERRRMPAKTSTVVYPEQSAVGHIRALLRLEGKTPLLAGPLRLARNESIVGRTRLDFAAAGEPLEIGFGTDDSIRVKRTVKEERDVTTLTGTQRIRRTVRVYVSNVSGEPKSFEVIERIPVSEIGDVEVIAETAEWTFDGADGFAKRRVELSAGAVASLLLSYEIRASSRVSLPF